VDWDIVDHCANIPTTLIHVFLILVDMALVVLKMILTHVNVVKAIWVITVTSQTTVTLDIACMGPLVSIRMILLYVSALINSMENSALSQNVMTWCKENEY